MRSKLLLSLLLVSAVAVAAPAAGPKPKPGTWGFNWFDPASTCKQMTAEDLAPIKKCKTSPNAFGIDLKSHQCQLNDSVELVIYDTKEQCQQAWETMQANGD